jgi:hypothetical protein
MKKQVLTLLTGLLITTLANASEECQHHNFKVSRAPDEGGYIYAGNAEWSNIFADMKARVLLNARKDCFKFYGSTENCVIHEETLDIYDYSRNGDGVFKVIAKIYITEKK